MAALIDRDNAKINGIDCNTETAEWVQADPAACSRPDAFRRFDEVLYRNPDGMYFIVRPLAPDEAAEWVRDQGDEALLRELFPDSVEAAWLRG